MPFEPKIYNNDDGAQAKAAPGNSVPEAPVWNDAELLDLPDDLAMLADQLRDDAAYVAARHPADASSEQRELAWKEFVDSKTTTAHPPRRWRWASAAAALAIVVALGSWLTYANFFGSPESETIIAAESNTGPAVVVEATVPAKSIESSEAIYPPNSELPGDQPRLIPASFLQDVSGPELDGMLDLLEDDEAGLSI